jgi:cytidylate kinase
MAVITISRQYGSGGDEIAKQVCRILGYQYFDKRLMAEVATEVGLSAGEIVDFSEDQHKSRGFLERLFGVSRPVTTTRVWTENVAGTRGVEELHLDEAQSISLVQSTIRAAYAHGNLVILGRGGQVVLKAMPDVLHVRIVASLEARLRRVQEWQQIGPEAAQRIIAERDAGAEDYLRRFYGVNWADPLLYDLMLNTGKWDTETAAHLIVNALNYLPFPAVASSQEDAGVVARE